MIFPELECAEISIPKTGTISRYAMIKELKIDNARAIIAKESNYGRLLDPEKKLRAFPLFKSKIEDYDFYNHGHFTYIQLQKFLGTYENLKMKNFYTFSFTRNPYARVYSMSKTVFYRQDKFKNLLKHSGRELKTKFGTQYEFLKDKNGNIGVDYVGKLENLEEDYNKIRKVASKLPPFKAEYKLNTNSATNDYKKVYDQETKDLVYKLFREDFENLGYKKDEL
jgi:hypothetical protein